MPRSLSYALCCALTACAPQSDPNVDLTPSPATRPYRASHGPTLPRVTLHAWPEAHSLHLGSAVHYTRLGATVDATGATWAQVETFDGRRGWTRD